MKRYYGENKGKGTVHTKGILYVMQHYAGKTLYAEDYEKLLRKLHMSTAIFEKFVLVRFGKYNNKPIVTIVTEM